MAENSNISWCRHTFNPWMGCTKVSPACDGCYAEALMDKRYHKVTWGPHGERVRTKTATWKRVEKWQREAAAARDNPFVFCASLADVFDNQVPTSWRSDLYKLVRGCPDLVFLFLSKRPQNIIRMSEAEGGLPGNVALGTTCEDQRRCDLHPHRPRRTGRTPLFRRAGDSDHPRAETRHGQGVSAMVNLIKPNTISFRATVTEDEIRQRMADEVLEQIGGLGADGKPLPGVRVRVTRGDSRKGGYSIEVSGPAPARILLPGRAQ